MANEITFTNNADLAQATTITQDMYQLTADRVDIRSTVMRVAGTNNAATLARKIRQVAFDDSMAAPGEITTVNPTALGDGAATVTAALQALRYDNSDETVLTGVSPTGPELTKGLAEGGIRRAAALIGVVLNGFTATAGTSGAALTVDDAYDAIFDLVLADVVGAAPTMLLSPKQYVDFMSSGRGEPDFGFQSPLQGMVGFKSQGFKGMWRGANVWTSSQVYNDGTDDYGACYLPGGCGYMELSVDQIRSVIDDNDWLNSAVGAGSIWVEKDRVSRDHRTEWVAAMICGAIQNEDDMGSTIRTVD